MVETPCLVWWSEDQGYYGISILQLHPCISPVVETPCLVWWMVDCRPGSRSSSNANEGIIGTNNPPLHCTLGFVWENISKQWFRNTSLNFGQIYSNSSQKGNKVDQKCHCTAHLQDFLFPNINQIPTVHCSPVQIPHLPSSAVAPPVPGCKLGRAE